MTTTMAITVADYLKLISILDRATSQPGSVASISDEQLVALQRRWTRALSARLDRPLDDAAQPIADAVAATGCELAEEQATLRRVLDVAEPGCAALKAAMGTEFRQLALAAGVVGVHDPLHRAVRLGQAYRRLIRSGIPFHSPRTLDSSASTEAA
jgi:hypothetical protein